MIGKDMLLVQFDHNWADEFNVHGLAIMTRDKYETLLLWATNANWFFGTNEGWEDKDLTSGFSIISEDTYKVNLISTTLTFYHYGSYPTWGNFPDPELECWYDKDGCLI